MKEIKIKYCSICEQQKPATREHWYPNRGGKDGLRSWCKLCTNKDNRAREKRSKEKWANTRKNGYLKQHYGISLEDYQKLLEIQGGKCKVCQTTDSGRKTSKFLSVDHCHKTGKVRGIVCSTCNSIIGFIEKTQDIKTTLKNLNAYLE